VATKKTASSTAKSSASKAAKKVTKKATKPTKKATKKVTKTVAKKAVLRDRLPTASTVWLEIGPIWLERHPSKPRELLVREVHSRRIQEP
jgi:hypothetical protein